MDRKIITPQTHPDHHAVGRCFKGCDGVFYFCDSHDSAIGYWMTPLFDGQVNGVLGREGSPAKRKNVSERAIGRTWMEITVWPEQDNWVTCQYDLTDEVKWLVTHPEELAQSIAAMLAKHAAVEIA